MKERSNVTIPSEIEATRLRFEEWRRRRTARERIPETLWSEAVELARRYGTWPAARALRLDYNKLKQLAVAGEERRALNPSTTFVEVIGSFELHCGDGEWPWSSNANRVEGSRCRPDGVEPDFLGWTGMIAVTAQTRIWVAVEPADFRCGIDGLARVCRQKLKADPFCGALFVFRNRRSTSVKNTRL